MEGHPLFAAIYDPFMAAADRLFLRPHRRYLVDGVGGDVLDLGCGPGSLFPFLADEETGSLHAIDPDPHMIRRANRRAASLRQAIDIREARAEDLPYEDDSMDYAIASMVFCTVDDTDTALDEVARVLRPGGEFRFLEHVAADGWRGSLQRSLAPVWRRLAAGCHLKRRTGELIRDHEAFRGDGIETIDSRFSFLTPFIRGRLTRR